MVRHSRAIPGKLHCVRPIACGAFPVYAENSREYTELKTQRFGTVIQMEIGAMLVGKICNYPRDGQVFQGEEKGYFEFGGSTILLLLEEGRLELSEEMAGYIGTGVETRIRLGELVGVCPGRD